MNHIFKPQKKDKISVKVKGVFSSAVPYEARTDGDWTPYYTDEPQRWGRWDSDDCWCLSSINCAQANLNWLWRNNMFSPEARSFYLGNGYCDANGVFSLSERFHEILCGNKDNGGTAMEAWQSFQNRGFIPRSQLTYTIAQANQWNTQQDFDNDYFNPLVVTPAMKNLGLQSLKYINIAYQRIGYQGQTPNALILAAALKQAPPNYGIPVDISTWNQADVPIDINTIIVHEVSARLLQPDGSYGIHDQYNPYAKNLAAGYYIGGCIQGVITAIAPASVNPTPQPTGQMNVGFWAAVFAWFNGWFTPNIGSS